MTKEPTLIPCIVCTQPTQQVTVDPFETTCVKCRHEAVDLSNKNNRGRLWRNAFERARNARDKISACDLIIREYEALRAPQMLCR